MATISSKLRWEAQVCDDCGRSVIHEIKAEPIMQRGDLCGVCHGMMRLITNPSVVANIVYATLLERVKAA